MPGPAENQDVEIVQGDSRILTIVVTDDDGANVDLTGATARWQVRKSSRGGELLISKATDGEGIVISSVAGSFRLVVTIDPADTADLERGRYYHEAEAIDNSGNVATVARGAFTVVSGLVP